MVTLPSFLVVFEKKIKQIKSNLVQSDKNSFQVQHSGLILFYFISRVSLPHSDRAVTLGSEVKGY